MLDRLYKTCAALPVRYNSSQDTGLSNLTIVQPMLYTRCGVTAAMGRRFDESYGNNGNYEIYEISAPPEISRAGKKSRSQYPWVKYRGAPFTHYSHNSHNSHYSHFLRRPHEPVRHDRLYKTCVVLPVRYDSVCCTRVIRLNRLCTNAV